MTTKLRFVEAAATAFNCTHTTVLAAVTGRHSVHPELCKQIKALADRNCNATTKEWIEFADAVSASRIADKILWAMISGADVKIDADGDELADAIVWDRAALKKARGE